MPTMPKTELMIKPMRLFLIATFILFSMPWPGFGKNVIQVETGNYQSASWQFTLELSELWQKKFPEEESCFAPVYMKDVEARFTNLIAGNSRFVIAPLDGVANQIMLSRPVRLVSLLWTVYLVPIDIGQKKEKINLNNYRYWYVSDHSVIVPTLMRALSKTYFAETARISHQQRIQGVPQADESEADTPESENGLFNIGQDEDTVDLQPRNTFEALGLNQESNSLDFKQSAEIAGLGSFGTEILRVDTGMIPEIVEEYREGIFFFEMIGSINHLKKSFASSISTAGFEQNIQDFLVSIHSWIKPVYKYRVGLNTLEFNMALYVHEDEDPEFVEEIIKMLSDPPKSYFPPSFLFGNLAVQKTKEVSPLFMHAGSLKYFDLD